MPKDIKCQNCVNLDNGWCEKVVDSPVPDMVRDCQYFRQKTNADRIRAMSDEELAKAIGILTYNDLCLNPCVEICEGCPFSSFCANCIEGHELEWLQQPAEEVHHEV